MKKISMKLFLVIIGIILLAPAMTTNVASEQSSELDNRALQEFPELKPGNGFRSQMEQYLSDRVGGRESMITFYQKLCDKFFNKLVHPLYIWGKAGHAMTTLSYPTYQHLDVDQKDVDYFSEYLKNMKDFCKKEGSEFLFFFATDKETIYPEYFPDGYLIQDQPNRTEKTIDSLEDKNVPYIYPKKLFFKKKKSELLYNKKFNVAHWNENGAFYGHQKILRYLQKKYPAIGELEKEEFDITQTFQKYLSGSKLEINEMVPVYTLKNTKALQNDKIFSGTTLNYYHEYYENESGKALGMPKILTIGDSYFEQAGKFYLNHCSELLMMHYSDIANVEYFITSFQPDIVIFEMVERMWPGPGRAVNSYIGKYTSREELYPDPYVLMLDQAKENEEFVKYKGELTDICDFDNDDASDTQQILKLSADINGKEYYAFVDKKNGTFQFLFKKKDLLKGQDIHFYCLTQ